MRGPLVDNSAKNGPDVDSYSKGCRAQGTKLRRRAFHDIRVGKGNEEGVRSPHQGTSNAEASDGARRDLGGAPGKGDDGPHPYPLPAAKVAAERRDEENADDSAHVQRRRDELLVRRRDAPAPLESGVLVAERHEEARHRLERAYRGYVEAVLGGGEGHAQADEGASPVLLEAVVALVADAHGDILKCLARW